MKKLMLVTMVLLFSMGCLTVVDSGRETGQDEQAFGSCGGDGGTAGHAEGGAGSQGGGSTGGSGGAGGEGGSVCPAGSLLAQAGPLEGKCVEPCAGGCAGAGMGCCVSQAGEAYCMPSNQGPGTCAVWTSPPAICVYVDGAEVGCHWPLHCCAPMGVCLDWPSGDHAALCQ